MAYVYTRKSLTIHVHWPIPFVVVVVLNGEGVRGVPDAAGVPGAGQDGAARDGVDGPDVGPDVGGPAFVLNGFDVVRTCLGDVLVRCVGPDEGLHTRGEALVS